MLDSLGQQSEHEGILSFGHCDEQFTKNQGEDELTSSFEFFLDGGIWILILDTLKTHIHQFGIVEIQA
jgi:hypothetical protein